MQKCASNTVSDCTCLTGVATAAYVNCYVVFAFCFNSYEGLLYDI